MTQAQAPSTVKVEVGYAGGRKGPYREHLAPETSLTTVRGNAMTHFGVVDSTDAAGNRIVFTLTDGNAPVDLAKTVDDLATGKHERELELRLIREVIAG